jgi:hypothetical protein
VALTCFWEVILPALTGPAHAVRLDPAGGASVIEKAIAVSPYLPRTVRQATPALPTA